MFFWLLGICDAADDKHKWCRLRSNHRNSNHDRWQLSYRFFYPVLSPWRAARRISRRANSKICIEAINSINEHSRQSRARALHIHLIIFMSIFSRYFSDWLKKKFQGIYWSACVEVLFFLRCFASYCVCIVYISWHSNLFSSCYMLHEPWVCVCRHAQHENDCKFLCGSIVAVIHKIWTSQTMKECVYTMGLHAE